MLKLVNENIDSKFPLWWLLYEGEPYPEPVCNSEAITWKGLLGQLACMQTLFPLPSCCFPLFRTSARAKKIKLTWFPWEWTYRWQLSINDNMDTQNQRQSYGNSATLLLLKVLAYGRKIVQTDVGRFAYKSIRIHRGCFADTTSVDSHTSKSFRLQFKSPTLKSIRIHNLSWFAYKKVIRLRI